MKKRVAPARPAKTEATEEKEVAKKYEAFLRSLTREEREIFEHAADNEIEHGTAEFHKFSATHPKAKTR